MLKSHGCGLLRAEHEGVRVALAGWVHAHRDHGGVIFVDLRDSSGIVQVVFEDVDQAQRLRDEWCVLVEGTVRARPAGTENPKLDTGAIEVAALKLEVLAPSAPLPFQIQEDIETDEALRLRYRYLDLRRAPLQHAIRLRARVRKAMREYLEERGFVEIETPIMARSTPEGARDYLVPSRHHPGSFWALAQSPQLFKELLMVSGFERYYQLAPCLRDEDTRADRQPEHTQLDLEMSFVEQRDVQEVWEGVMHAVWKQCAGVDLPAFPRMSYAESMDRYGTDKPDLRAGPAIVDLSAAFASTAFRAFAETLAADGAVRGLLVPGGGDMSRSQRDGLTSRAQQLGAKGLAWMIVHESDLEGKPVRKFLSDAELEAIRTGMQCDVGDLVLLVAEAPRKASEILGRLRVELASGLDPFDYRFVWILDYPMFAWDEARGGWDVEHNAFCAITGDTVEFIESDPARCVSEHYDLVCNGTELGSGSIRIHRADVQMRVLRAIGLSEEDARARFGFLMDAFAYGPPPHGGFGMGLDRVVMLLGGWDSLRDVIAFPKTGTGADLMTGAPAPVDPAHLKELGLRLLDPT